MLLFAPGEPAEDRLRAEWARLRAETTLALAISGADTYGPRNEPWAVDAYVGGGDAWTFDLTEREHVGKREERLTFRLVADGRTFYRLDPVRRTWSAAQYSASGAPDPTRDRLRFLSLLSAAVSGRAEPVARLLTQVHGPDEARYVPWMPTSLLKTGEADPTYQLGDPARRKIVFAFGSGDDPRLLDVAAFDQSNRSGLVRRTAWTMHLERSPAVRTVDFDPKTLVGWRAVPWPRRSAG